MLILKNLKMKNKKVYIGGFAYQLGETESQLEELNEIMDNREQISRLRKADFDKFNTSSRTVMELAGQAIDNFFGKTPILPSKIDAVVFATSSFGMSSHLSHQVLCDFMLEKKLTRAYPLISSLSFCGNFLPALKMAYQYVNAGEFKNVLVVVSDIIPIDSSRLTPPDIAVGSDASACCLISEDNFSGFEVNSIYQAVNVNTGMLDPGKDFLEYTKSVGIGIKEAVSRTFAHDLDNSIRDGLTKVFTNNYSTNVCKSFLRLMNVSTGKLFGANISRFGHAGAADICINMHDYLHGEDIRDNESMLILSTGPFMWGTALIHSSN